jgi:hypothetical protein
LKLIEICPILKDLLAKNKNPAIVAIKIEKKLNERTL